MLKFAPEPARRCAGGQGRFARDMGQSSHSSCVLQRLTSCTQTGDRGFGLKTDVPIKAGQYIIEYRGEVRSMSRLYTIVRCSTSMLSADHQSGRVLSSSQYRLQRFKIVLLSRLRRLRCHRCRELPPSARMYSRPLMNSELRPSDRQGQRGNAARFINHS